MKFFIVLCALVAAASADVSHLSNKYLPPHAASAPAASFSPAPAAASYHVEAASAPAPAVSYSAPAAVPAPAPVSFAPAPAAQSFHVEAASAPAASYETASFETAAAEPAHTFSSDEGYRYKTVKRRVIRRRRDVSTEYLPPVAASAPVAHYESAPVESYAAPAASFESYEVAAAEPAHSFSSAEGYRYRTAKRRVIRRRRDVSTEYLPPVASAPVAQYESAPVESYAAPAASYESYEVAAAEPAHSFSSADGYRYKTSKRRVIRRRRRDVSTEYLPPVASAPVAQYESAPVESYAAPAASYESYEVAAAEPAHSFSSADGYRYKTSKRRVIRRRRRDVSHLSSEYLPPVAASSPSAEYLPPVAASAPVAQFESAPSFSVGASAPAASFSSFETAAAEPAHSFSSAEGYRYKTAKRRVIRRRRDVSTEYLPPVAASHTVGQLEAAPVEIFSAPASSAPAVSYQTYDAAATEPAHIFSSAEGYRYKTAKRRVIRRQRRDVSHLSSEYLPPHQGAASAPSAEYLPPVAASAPVAQFESAPAVSYSAPAASYSAPAVSYESAATEPAHSFSSAEGYRYKTAKRRVIRRRRY